MRTDELRCSICGAEARPNEKGRLVLEHDWQRHTSDASAAPVTPLRRPSRTGAWGDDDD